MDKKCVLPEINYHFDGKNFILPNFDTKYILNCNNINNNSKVDAPLQLYEDEVACKINTDKLKEKPPQINKKEKEYVKEYKPKRENKEDFTHFISIPLLDLREQIEALQEEIQNYSEMDLTSHFQGSEITHLTLFMLRLHTEELKAKAIKIMEQNEQEIRNILCETRLHLKGLHFFEQFSKKNYKEYKTKNARILFLKLQENEAYQCIEKLGDFLIKKFIEAKILMEDQLSHIKFDERSNMYKGNLHITILRAKNEKGIAVDEIMQNFKNFNLGTTDIKTIEISTRFEYDQYGYYKPLHKINLKK